MRISQWLLVAAVSVAAATPLSGQTRSGAAQSPSSADLRMRETGIQGERQRPDVLFIIPTGRSGPIISPRLRDYGYEIQEPVVKMWLEGDLRIARNTSQARGTVDFDWREAVRAAKERPAAQAGGPVPSMMRPQGTGQLGAAPSGGTAPGMSAPSMGSGPRVAPPGIPREALSGGR